jgi:hypothetical protein
MNGARDTVVQLDVQLGDGVFFIDGGFLKITDSSSFDHVTDSETLDGLVLSSTIEKEKESEWGLKACSGQYPLLPWGNSGSS